MSTGSAPAAGTTGTAAAATSASWTPGSASPSTWQFINDILDDPFDLVLDMENQPWGN